MTSPEIQLLDVYRDVFQPPFSVSDAPVPKAAGQGRFRQICRWPDAIISESLLTPSGDSCVSAASESPGIELFFCLGEGMEWDSDISPRPLTLYSDQLRLTPGRRGMERTCYFQGRRYHFIDVKLTASGMERLLYSQMCAAEQRQLRSAIESHPAFTLAPSMRITLDQLMRCPYSGAAGTLYLESQLLALLAEFIGILFDPARPRAVSAADLQSIQEARHILDGNLNAPPTIRQLARCVYLSESRLTRCFRAVTGQSIHQYVIEQRLYAARAMLEAGESTVSEAAHRVGYINISHFSAAYRKRFGCNPGEYRRSAHLSTDLEP